MKYLYIPLQKELLYYFNGLFYRRATGNLRTGEIGKVLYAHDIKNRLLAKDIKGNYSSTKLDYLNWGKEKTISEFTPHSKKNPYQSAIIKLRNKFGKNIFISFLILSLTF